MKLIGYCEQCQRIKQVNVRPEFLLGGVARGICDACRDKERTPRGR